MMSQNSKPLITIVGALSKQGRSAAHTLLQSGRYRLRALTRRVDAPEAQSLARQGAELVTVPLEVGHKIGLVDAFRGSQGVFLMTPPIAPPNGDTLVFPIYLPENFRAPFVDPLTATGPAVLEIFANPDKYAGKSLPVIGDIISPSEIVETFRRVTGKKAAYRSAFTREELLHHFPAFGANELLVRELLGMAEYAVEYGYYRKDRDLLWSRQVNPSSVSWEQFLRTTEWQGQAQSFGV
jgi:hypothetical protein